MSRTAKGRARRLRRERPIASVPPEMPDVGGAFSGGYPTREGAARLRDELLYVNAVTAYLWALPVLSMCAMKEGSEKTFGKGYNVLPIWKTRLDARTLITTPNSDVIYAMGYLDLKNDGPMVIEAPPGLQGVLDDFFQRPIRSIGRINGRTWSGDVGLPGPDQGKGGKYLVLPPDFDGSVPPAVLRISLADIRRVRLLARILPGSDGTRRTGARHGTDAHLPTRRGARREERCNFPTRRASP